MKRILLLFIVMGLVLCGCNTVDEQQYVSGVVTKLEYKKASYIVFSSYNVVTKSFVSRSQYVPPKYLVTIEYNEVSETFDNKKLYKGVKKGEVVQVILIKKYDKKTGQLRKQTLKLVK